MASKIIESLSRFLPGQGSEEILSSGTFGKIRSDLEYFEEFVDDSQVPDLVGLITDIISARAVLMTHPQLSVGSPNTICDTLSLSEDGRGSGPIVYLGDMSSTAEIGLSSGTYGEQNLSGPVIHINRVGYNRSDLQKLAKGGLIVEGYRIPEDIALKFLNDFDKAEGNDRNEILLWLAASEDKTGCYPANHWVNYYNRIIQDGGNPLPGIDESSVHIIGRNGAKVETFGNAHHCYGDPAYYFELRVTRPGKVFAVPSKGG